MSEPAPTTKAPRKRKRRLRVRILALVISLLLSLLVAEVAARIFDLGGTTLTRGSLHQHDPDAGWICAANLDARFERPGSFSVRVRCNSRGLRGPEHTVEKPAGIRRIVVLGDSAMWGQGVENDEVLAHLLETRLANTETINLGANGYSTVQELVRLETEGLRYSPDVVLLAFTPNDLADNFDDKKGGRPIAELADDGSVTITNRPVRRRWKSPITQWARHNSRLFSFIEYRLQRMRVMREMKEADERRLEDLEAASKAHAEAAQARTERRRKKGEFILTYLDTYGAPGPLVDQAWRAELALLRKVKELAATKGARLVVVFNPGDIDMATPERFAAISASMGLDVSNPKLGLDKDRPRERLGAICKEIGVDYVDPTPNFVAFGDPDPLFLKKDHHWTPKGTELVADAVVARLKAPD